MRAHRILLPVRMRIHCGMGRFCLSFLASVFLVAIDLLAGCERERGGGCAGEQAACACARVDRQRREEPSRALVGRRRCAAGALRLESEAVRAARAAAEAPLQAHASRPGVRARRQSARETGREER